MMLVLCALTTGLMVVFSYVQQDMMTTLSEKNQPAFYDAINRYIIIIVIAARFALYNYVQNLVELEWRLWLTRLLVKKYFSKHACFALKAEARWIIRTSAPARTPGLRAELQRVVTRCRAKAAEQGPFGASCGTSPHAPGVLLRILALRDDRHHRLFGSKLMGLHFQALPKGRI